MQLWRVAHWQCACDISDINFTSHILILDYMLCASGVGLPRGW
jgi:hypothetical protein